MALMEDDIEEKQFEQLMADKRHKEVVKLLGELLIAFKSDKKEDKGLVEALAKQAGPLKELTLAIEKLGAVEKQEITIENNQDEVKALFNNIQEVLLPALKENTAELKKFNDRPMAQSFDVVKDKFGVTKNVKINYA